MSSDLTASIAETVRSAREARGLSANALAERSGVSRAMIAKVERAEAQPTAALLGRLSAALGLTLSELVARAERSDRRLVRAGEQPTWTDPDTGYRRRALSPVAGGPLELVEVELPAGAEIAYPADAYAFIHQQIWMLDGSLTIREDGSAHDLEPGDCIEFPVPSARTFLARGACRYLVALTRRA
ncbi:helix-turn-helix transcriptional regulator [Solirubrobacter sp. CPCC 204708]|uniref:XRE family transcriptional regulator n=1 Tax=Solirubrobacter deserti TaxID=2282478 RepID=A0ABT4REY0_9ACTN|nr:XRE family transcriptional regulator [Solirubrobacter deserti]MBE2318643.1 helix-turn-helix transcriptional regulator [Solirubrobacter deserti]MDA0137101.1 XRE family transcriptional regulator [Solirubrobacter deserti]